MEREGMALDDSLGIKVVDERGKNDDLCYCGDFSRCMADPQYPNTILLRHVEHTEAALALACTPWK
jgi:hypothetical protein